MLEGKKILLTGLTGQVGGAFAKLLAPRNEVWGLARFTKAGTFEAARAAGVHAVKGDYTSGDFGNLPEEVDYVVHIAAATGRMTAEDGMVQNAEGTGLLMYRFRNAKAFVHTSASGCYFDNADPLHSYREEDDLGGVLRTAPNYAVTKTAAEGVVRTLARIHNIPTTIARLDVAVSGYDDGGMMGMLADDILAGRPIRYLPGFRECFHSPLDADDMVEHLDAFVKAASVPATIVNWGGPEGVSMKEACLYMGELLGREVIFDFSRTDTLWGRVLDPSFGRSIGMTWKIGWKEAVRRMLEARHPDKLRQG